MEYSGLYLVATLVFPLLGPADVLGSCSDVCETWRDAALIYMCYPRTRATRAIAGSIGSANFNTEFCINMYIPRNLASPSCAELLPCLTTAVRRGNAAFVALYLSLAAPIVPSEMLFHAQSEDMIRLLAPHCCLPYDLNRLSADKIRAFLEHNRPHVSGCTICLHQIAKDPRAHIRRILLN